MFERAHGYIRGLFVASTLRYAITGIVVALINFIGPVVLNAVTGLALEACIPIVFAFALCVHFTSQRLFVWRHQAGFHLGAREQIGRYLASAAVQYGVTAGLTAWLPGVLGWPQRVVYVLVALTVTIAFFVVLRGFVFHAREEEFAPPGAETASGPDPRSDEATDLARLSG
jgi:putative flippase GtrA